MLYNKCINVIVGYVRIQSSTNNLKPKSIDTSTSEKRQDSHKNIISRIESRKVKKFIVKCKN